MTRSGLIFGVVSLVLILVITLISPFCAPCLGLFLGLAAGYVAGVFAKPIDSRQSVRVGGIAGLIAGGIGLAGSLVGGIINVSATSAASIEQLVKTLGLPGITLTQSQVTTYQILGAVCIGAFNIFWMAIFGIAGGALWYQVVGKNRPMTVLPPQEPIPPAG